MFLNVKLFALTICLFIGSTQFVHAQFPKSLTDGTYDPTVKGNKTGVLIKPPFSGKRNDTSPIGPFSSGPTGPKAGRDFTRIVIKNNSSRSMRVAVDFTPFSANGQTGRVTKTWYQMDPGGQIYIGDTNVRWFAFYAESLDQSVTWGGDTMITVPRDDGSQSVGFRVVDTGSQRLDTWTVPLGD
jgi:hypothetical protein